MKNLGKANIQVNILSELPNIIKNTRKYNFDISAANWPTIVGSSVLQPLLTENLTDVNTGFSVCYPSKRKYFIDNYIVKSNGTNNSDTTKPFINWKVLDSAKSYIVKQITSSWGKMTVEQPDKYNNKNYTGPKWYDDPQAQKDPPPNDIGILGEWIQYTNNLDKSQLTSSQTQQSSQVQLIPSINYINQSETREGMWWGIESSDFLYENMPFWINIKRTTPPPSNEHETFIIVSIGSESKDQKYDIYLSNQKKPMIIDYFAGGEGPYAIEEFDIDLSRLLTHEENIEIGFMTIVGKLIVFVNKNVMVYNRIKRSGDPETDEEIEEAKIAPGKIELYGSNVQMAINVCPMTFAPLSVMAFELPVITDPTGKEETKNIQYAGVKNDNTYGGSVAVLPIEPEVRGKRYGVDCRTFNSFGSTDRPIGLGFHKLGQIAFVRGNSLNIDKVHESGTYINIMRPEDTKFGGESNFVIPYGGCPYFFQLKGGFAVLPEPLTPTTEDVTEYVFSVEENTQSSDYFYFEKSATVVLYNKNGVWDKLKNKQYGIEISWGWNESLTKTFTGVITSVNSTETAGKESLSLQCQDYMYILKNTQIVNSPYYDGMIYHHAIEEMAQRAGIATIIDGWGNLKEVYALKSGYMVTQPAVRFSSEEKIFDCIMSIVKMAEAFIYFDSQGQFHVAKLPGGLLASPTDVVANFTTNPDSDNPYKILLNEKALDISFDSTANKISILTVNRNDNNLILMSTSSSNNILRYKREIMIDQPALGDRKPARVWMMELASRVFWPIRKISFNTVGYSSLDLNVFDMITVDDLEYRLMGFNRNYNAENNDFVSEYNAEWLYGK